MDVSANRPFKAKMQEQWMEQFRQHQEITKQRNRKQLTRQDVINWVSRAWQNVAEEVISQSFTLCGITAEIDGSENDLIFSHVPQVLAEEVEEEMTDEETEDDENESPESFVGDDLDPFSDL